MVSVGKRVKRLKKKTNGNVDEVKKSKKKSFLGKNSEAEKIQSKNLQGNVKSARKAASHATTKLSTSAKKRGVGSDESDEDYSYESESSMES